MTKRFSYRKPIGGLGHVHGLVSVWENGTAIGHVNKTASGYAIRDLGGKLIDTLHVHDRDTAAGLLSQTGMRGNA